MTKTLSSKNNITILESPTYTLIKVLKQYGQTPQKKQHRFGDSTGALAEDPFFRGKTPVDVEDMITTLWLKQAKRARRS